MPWRREASMIRKSGNRFFEKIMLKQKTLESDSTQLNQTLGCRIVARDQAVLGCDLYGAVAGHFNRVTVLSGAVGEYRDDRAYRVIAERLIHLVADREFAGHQKSFDSQALRPVGFK
jgi:hypothetical protein